jgi:hypothetical protein
MIVRWPIAHGFARVLCVAIILIATPLRGNDLPTIKEVTQAWQHRSQAIQLEWKHDVNGAYRFHHYQSEWLTANDGDLDLERLEIDGRRLRFEAVRWTTREHGYDSSQINGSQVIEVFPERKEDLYMAALHSHFADARVEFRNLRPFLRVFNGTVLEDYWPPHAEEYPRGVIRQGLSTVGPMETRALPRGISDELQDLSVMAAILALYPLHPSLAVPVEDYGIAAQPVIADGKPCAVLLKPRQDETGYRTTIWVDTMRDFCIRRLISHDGRQGYQIDIEYQQDKQLGWVPSEWTACSFDEKHGARLDAVHCLVTRSSPRDALTNDESTVRFDSGTWIIDEASNEQYILREDGTMREILPREFDWLPTHSELNATGPAEVGMLVERKIHRIQYWRSARIPLALGVIAIASGLVLARRRRHRKSTPANSFETTGNSFEWNSPETML